MIVLCSQCRFANSIHGVNFVRPIVKEREILQIRRKFFTYYGFCRNQARFSSTNRVH